MTKKGRTALTSFAGSIGIIGIALILSLSNGIQLYINDVQEDTLSGYPVTIQTENIDLEEMLTAFMKRNTTTVKYTPPPKSRICSTPLPLWILPPTI